jgi:hypothetical protein
MNTLLKLFSFIGLGLTVIPPFLIFAQAITWKTYLTLMTIGTLLWFLTAPFWMKRES